MIELITKTAWIMTPPKPYSTFHIVFTVFGLTAAVFCAYIISKKAAKQGVYRFLFGCGLLLAAGELYKQLFLYYVVNEQTYDWWYFPFQLCSIPMYLCLALPLYKGRRIAPPFLTFLTDYSLLGGIMALAEPSGLMHPYWTLTLHGLCWHVILILIGLTLAFCRITDFSIRGYGKTLPILAICCLIATAVNWYAEPLGQADMFYLSPYYPSNQIVFHEFAVKYGILAGNILYIIGMCAGGFVIHWIFGWLTDKKEDQPGI